MEYEEFPNFHKFQNSQNLWIQIQQVKNATLCSWSLQISTLKHAIVWSQHVRLHVRSRIFFWIKIRKMECCFHPLMELLYLATAREMGRKKNTVILCLPLWFQSLFFFSLHEKRLLTLNPTLMESTELSKSCQTWNSYLQDFLIVLVVGDLQQNMNDCPLTLWCPILIVCKNSLILRVWVNIFKLTGWGWVHACFSNWFQHCWRIC